MPSKTHPKSCLSVDFRSYLVDNQVIHPLFFSPSPFWSLWKEQGVVYSLEFPTSMGMSSTTEHHLQLIHTLYHTIVEDTLLTSLKREQFLASFFQCHSHTFRLCWCHVNYLCPQKLCLCAQVYTLNVMELSYALMNTEESSLLSLLFRDLILVSWQDISTCKLWRMHTWELLP